MEDGLERVTVYPRDGGEPWTYLRAVAPEVTCDYCGTRLGRSEKAKEYRVAPAMTKRRVALCGSCVDGLTAAALVAPV